MPPDAETAPDPDAQRAEQRDRWDAAAPGWETRAEAIEAFGRPVARRMVDALELGPGQRVLDLAAGPGDTGFLAAERVEPGGVLICSDASPGMLDVARRRAAERGVGNVEFKRIELEWIDLRAASVDAILCRWGLMFAVDPEAAAREARRVLRPGGRIALAVWDDPAANPWASIPNQALVALGHTPAPDPNAPGMFALAAPGRLSRLLEGAGFTDVAVEGVAVERQAADVEAFIAETLDLSGMFAEAVQGLSAAEREVVTDTIARLSRPFQREDGSVVFPGRSLVATAGA